MFYLKTGILHADHYHWPTKNDAIVISEDSSDDEVIVITKEIMKTPYMRYALTWTRYEQEPQQINQVLDRHHQPITIHLYLRHRILLAADPTAHMAYLITSPNSSRKPRTMIWMSGPVPTTRLDQFLN